MTNVTLSPEQERFAADAVAAGRYRSIDEVVRAALAGLQRLELQRADLLASVVAAETEGERDGFMSSDEVEAHPRRSFRGQIRTRVTRLGNFSPRAASELEKAVPRHVQGHGRPVGGEKPLMAAIHVADLLVHRPLLGRRRLDLLPDPYRFWSLGEFPNVLDD
jgi:antitoxin ParD1/3/4